MKNQCTDIRFLGEALNNLLYVYSLMKSERIPKTEENKIAMQNSIKELCMAIFDCL